MSCKTHLRRCHVCGSVTECSGNLVNKCGECGKHLPSYYYFDELLAMGLKTIEEAAGEYRSSALPLKEYPPLTGLSVYWDGA